MSVSKKSVKSAKKPSVKFSASAFLAAVGACEGTNHEKVAKALAAKREVPLLDLCKVVYGTRELYPAINLTIGGIKKHLAKNKSKFRIEREAGIVRVAA